MPQPAGRWRHDPPGSRMASITMPAGLTELRGQINNASPPSLKPTAAKFRAECLNPGPRGAQMLVFPVSSLLPWLHGLLFHINCASKSQPMWYRSPTQTPTSVAFTSSGRYTSTLWYRAIMVRCVTGVHHCSSVARVLANHAVPSPCVPRQYKARPFVHAGWSLWDCGELRLWSRLGYVCM